MIGERHGSLAISRRALLGAAAGVTAGGWLRDVAALAAGDAARKRSCILLWMSGGPSQLDTFDTKPDHSNGGPVREIATTATGVTISEHLPNVAKWMHRQAIVRSMSTREGDHRRATDHLRTGYTPQGSIQFPALGSLVSNEYANRASDLPNYVSVLPAGFSASGSSAGFLGPDHAPVVVADGGAGDSRVTVANLAPARLVSSGSATARWDMLSSLDRDFHARRQDAGSLSHQSAYERARRLMSQDAASAFDLEAEPADVREAYGASRFGRGCLLARRLVERGVPFVEVSLGGWDTHDNNFAAVRGLCGTLDMAWGELMSDLDERGLLDSTLIVWMGEFGRTPVINPRQGRDHYPKAWSVVLGGGGIRGGEVVGRTSSDGMEVVDRPVSVPDLLATVCLGLGLDPMKQNMSNVGRPIRLADPEARPLAEILT